MPEPTPSTGWTVVADRDRCMGTGSCMVYAPATLTYDAEGKVAVTEPIADDLDAVRAAVEACPTAALTIVGDTD